MRALIVGALSMGLVTNGWAEPYAHQMGSDSRATEEEQTLRVSATVDATTVDVGATVTLTITLEGDLDDVDVRPVEFPKPFRMTRQSRSSSFSFQIGRMQRSINLVYVLVALEPGTFQLGPFEVVQKEQSIVTDPIEIVVNKPTLPPRLKESPRFVL